MIGFIKAAFKPRSTPSKPAASSSKPLAKVAPRGKTNRYGVFKKTDKGEEARRFYVQDEDDDWYKESRSGTGEKQYKKVNIAGAATSIRLNKTTGKHEPVAEYDSREQRFANMVGRAGGTLRKEGDPVTYSGVKETKRYGSSFFMPPVEPRSQKTIVAESRAAGIKRQAESAESARKARENKYRESSRDVSAYMSHKIEPKTGAGDPFDYAAKKSKEAKLSKEIGDYIGDYHSPKVKPKFGTGYDSFDAGFAKPHVKPKPAGTERAGSAGSKATTPPPTGGSSAYERMAAGKKAAAERRAAEAAAAAESEKAAAEAADGTVKPKKGGKKGKAKS